MVLTKKILCARLPVAVSMEFKDESIASTTTCTCNMVDGPSMHTCGLWLFSELKCEANMQDWWGLP